MTVEMIETSATGALAGRLFGAGVEVYLCAERPPAGVASTVVDVSGEKLRILREGTIASSSVREAAGTPT